MTGIIDNANRRTPHHAASTDPIAGALVSVYTSAIAVIRESGGLVRHLAGVGIALITTPTSPSKRAPDRPRAAAPARDNVIPFPIATAARMRSRIMD